MFFVLKKKILCCHLRIMVVNLFSLVELLLFLIDYASCALVSTASLANVDPIDVAQSTSGLNPETTLGTALLQPLSLVTFLYIKHSMHSNIWGGLLSGVQLLWFRRLLQLLKPCSMLGH